MLELLPRPLFFQLIIQLRCCDCAVLIVWLCWGDDQSIGLKYPVLLPHTQLEISLKTNCYNVPKCCTNIHLCHSMHSWNCPNITHTNSHFYCHKHGRKMSQHFIKMFRFCRHKISWKMSRSLINIIRVGCHKQLAMTLTPDLLGAGKCLLFLKVLVDFQLQVGELLTIDTCTNTHKQLGIMGLTHSWCVGKNWRNML